MNISVGVLGQTFLVSAILTSILAYVLAKDKVQNRGWAPLFGFVGGLVQPIGIILLIVLWLRKPLNENV